MKFDIKFIEFKQTINLSIRCSYFKLFKFVIIKQLKQQIITVQKNQISEK